MLVAVGIEDASSNHAVAQETKPVVRVAIPTETRSRIPSNLPLRVVVGDPRGPCPMARVDASRGALTDVLPDEPSDIWNNRRNKPRGRIIVPAAVDDTGDLVIATDASLLVQYTRDGRVAWQSQVRGGAATTGPVITSDGTRVVLNSAGHAWGFGRDGSFRFDSDLGRFGTSPMTAPLPMDDGSVVVAVGSEVVVLGRDGSVIKHANVGERVVGGVVGDGAGVVVTTESGGVLRWVSPLLPRKIGTFRGKIAGTAAKTVANALVAVVDGSRFVLMDLSTGTATTLLSRAGLVGPPVVGDVDLFYVPTSAGTVLSVSRSGVSRSIRVFAAPSEVDLGPIVADKSGRIAFVVPTGPVGIIAPNGQTRYGDSIGCVLPTDLVPAGPNRYAVVCNTGDVYLFGS